MKPFFLTGICSLCICYFTLAQKNLSTASQTLNVRLGDVIEIYFASNDLNSGPQLQMAFTSAEDYHKGIETQKQMLKVRSNKNFTVSVRAVNRLSGNALPSFIYIRVPDNNTGGSIAQAFSNNVYQLLTNNESVLLEDADRGDHQSFSVQYKAKPGTMVDPGVYTIDVIFTASGS